MENSLIEKVRPKTLEMKKRKEIHKKSKEEAEKLHKKRIKLEKQLTNLKKEQVRLFYQLIKTFFTHPENPDFIDAAHPITKTVYPTMDCIPKEIIQLYNQNSPVNTIMKIESIKKCINEI